MKQHTLVRRRHRSEAQWRAIMTRYAASGLSVSAFCREQAIGASSFYHWRGRLGHDRGTVGVDRDEGAAEFIDLGALAPKGTGGSRLDLTLDLGGGLTLHLVRS